MSTLVTTFHILMASLELLEMKIKPYNCSMKMSIYEIQWTTKAHSDKIKIDENLVLPEYKSEYTVSQTGIYMSTYIYMWDKGTQDPYRTIGAETRLTKEFDVLWIYYKVFLLIL